jgi:hypothetical protein
MENSKTNEELAKLGAKGLQPSGAGPAPDAAAASASRTGIGPISVDPAAGRPFVQRGGAGSGMTDPLGTIANYTTGSAAPGSPPRAFPTHGLALRNPATGDLQSVDEHVYPRGIAERITTDNRDTTDLANRVSPITDKVYDRMSTLRTTSETGDVKTVGDNEAMQNFDLASTQGQPLTPAEDHDMSLQGAIERQLAAAREVGDSSVTAENVLTTAHAELGDMSRAGSDAGQVQDVLKGVSQKKLEAMVDNLEGTATVDEHFASAQGMGLPMPEDPVPASGFAAAAGAEGGVGGEAAGAIGAGALAEGGVIGGVMSGGVTALQDADQVRDGTKMAGDATAEVVEATGVGAAAGIAGVVVGAEIGAEIGTAIPVPIVGTAVGLVAGAVVGGMVASVGKDLAQETGATEAIGEFLDDHFEQPLESAWDEFANFVDAVKSAAGDAADAVTDAVAQAVSDANSAVAERMHDMSGAICWCGRRGIHGGKGRK